MNISGGRESFRGNLGVEEREKRGMLLEMAGETIAKLRPDGSNEDSFLMNNKLGYFGVFDGIGGHAHGGEASKIAKHSVNNYLERILGRSSPEEISLDTIKDCVSRALTRAHEDIKDVGGVRGEKMGTTASVGIVFEDKDGKIKAVIGNIGDSRVYFLRNGKLNQVTLDDNEISYRNDAYQLQAKMSNVIEPESELTEEELSFFNRRNVITQSLGSRKYVEPNIHVSDVYSNDKILVCSDGVSDNLTDKEIEDLLRFNITESNDFVATKLVNEARVRSNSSHPRAKPDDITAVLITYASAKTDSASLPNRVTNHLISGEKVVVLRSNGQIETDWTIDGFDPHTGDAIVFKVDSKGRRITKTIPREELERYN